MSDLKTKVNDGNVDLFLEKVEHKKRREDGKKIRELMENLTQEKAQMWGANIVGFGRYHYVYASGREGDWFVTGFSPRKTALTLYIMSGFSNYDQLMSQLGKHKTGKSCLYINKLDDIDMDVLSELISASLSYMREKYPNTDA